MSKTLHRRIGHHLLMALLLFLASSPLLAQSNALHFSYATKNRVDIGPFAAGSPDFSQGFSFAGWVKFDNFNELARVFTFAPSATDGSNNLMLCSKDASGQLMAEVNVQKLITSTTLQANKWYFLALTISSTGHTVIYVDGVAVAGQTLSAPANIARNTCYLGNSSYDEARGLNGSLDEVSIWSRTLSQAEIAGIMNGISSPASQTGLLAYYTLNQGTAGGTNTGITTLTDASGKDKHATLRDFVLTGSTSNWVEGVSFTAFVPLTVNITTTDNTVVTSSSSLTLQEAIGSIPLSDVKMLEITNGNFNTADWQWLQANRTSLSNLTHFTITNSIASVAIIPFVAGVNPYFGHQLEELHVAKLQGIGKSAFDYDKDVYSGIPALTSASFPNLAVLGDYAFYECSSLYNMLLGATPPSTNVGSFYGLPTPRYLTLADANGNLLTGSALENARLAYKAVDDENTSDNLWHGWTIDRDLYKVNVASPTNGTITAGNPDATVFGAYPAGATINVTATPNEGYLFIPGDLRAHKTGDESILIPVTSNTFAMPDFEVTVTADFITLSPNLTFVSENTGELKFETRCSSPSQVLVDWGNGSIETFDIGITPATLSTAAYTSGNTVKVYGINIDYLNIHAQNITSLDVCNLPAMNELRCGSNKLSALDVSQNTALLYLSCFENNLSQIDVTQNSALEYLDIDENNLTHLDVSQNPQLKTLYCSSNRMSFQSLPVPNASYSTYLFSPQQNLAATCSNGIVDLSSQLTALDVAGNTQNTVYTWYLADGTALVEDVDYKSSGGVFLFQRMPASDVYCTMINAAFPVLTLRTVDITVDAVVEPAITFVSQKDGEKLISGRTFDSSSILVDWGDGVLVADGEKVSYMDIQFSTSSYVAGSIVKIYGNLFEDVDFSGYNYILADYTVTNEIVSLDVSRATTLDVLYCENNSLSELDVSKNTTLRLLYVENNNLSSIDVSKNSMLEVLSLYNNNLTFASLPQRKASYNTYEYQPQQDLAATCTYGTVDLNSQFTALDINGVEKTTVYTWFLEDDTPLVNGIDYTQENGVFYFQQLPASPVYCLMTNSAFPDLTLRTVEITMDMVAPTHITWTGEADLDWHNPFNWNPNVIPDQTHIVIVPVGPKYPVIWFETTASCHSITLKGEATGIASVIIYGSLSTVDGVTVERYVPAGAFEYVSSPVANLTASVFAPLATKPADGNGLFEFSTEGNAWSAPITNAETPLTALKGFAFIAKESGTITFEGDAFHTGNQSIALTKTATTGFNLVGNPYPSAINWGSMSGWERENVSPVIWINYADAPSDANFATFNHLTPETAINWLGNVGSALGAIAPTQAFWVYAESDKASLSVKPNAQVVSSNAVNKKSEAVASPLIRLQAQRSGYSDEMVIFFHSEATEGMDRFDTRKKLGSGPYPQIYAPVADAIAAVNTLPQSLLSERVVVPITLKSDMAGSITIALTELKNLGDDMDIILTDKATGTQTDLRTSAYTVEVESNSTLTNRLEVTIERKNVTSAPAIDKSTVNIYASAKNIYVGMAQQGSRVEVYNAIGVQMLSQKLNGGVVESIQTNLPKGVYIVVVNGSEGRTVKRVFIQ